MARVRVQGQARRPRSAAATGRAVPPPARLDDLVHPALAALRGRLVPAVPRPAARGRRGDAPAAAPQPVPRRAAVARPGPPVPLPLLHLAGVARDGPLV